MFSFPLGKAGMVLVAGEVSMMRERGGYMVEMSASSTSDGVAFSRRRYSQLEFITINKQKNSLR